jgi:outer membrane lipoprotein-sorting protein
VPLVNTLRRLSTRNLLLVVAGFVAAIAAATAAAVATAGGGPTPAAKPLAPAVNDALAAPAPSGITARVSFTNNLFPSGSMFGGTTSALVSGASGRLWLTNEGRGRVELQSDAGDVQIVWNRTRVTLYDASSNTAYVYNHAAPKSTQTQGVAPTLSEITSVLKRISAHASVSAPQPDDVAGQPAYSVTVSPKQHGGLVGAAQLAWDAVNGVPLRVAITAKGASTPVLSLTATDISFGAVSDSAVNVAPPASAKVVDLSSKGHRTGQASVTGLDAVRAAVPFTLVAPATLADRQLSSARTAGHGAVLTYGEGLDAIVVHESTATGSSGGSSGIAGLLPAVTIGSLSAHELQTPLGTVLTFSHGGVDFVVAGSVTKSVAETAASALG